jgi:hypothetical protein
MSPDTATLAWLEAALEADYQRLSAAISGYPPAACAAADADSEDDEGDEGDDEGDCYSIYSCYTQYACSGCGEGMIPYYIGGSRCTTCTGDHICFAPCGVMVSLTVRGYNVSVQITIRRCTCMGDYDY